MWALLKTAGRTLALGLIVLVSMLLSCQSRMIYFPRPYDRGSLWDLEQRKGQHLEFTTSQGRQVAFYLPPRGNTAEAPSFVWMVCGGNGSLALDYAEEPLHWDERFGYLFVDYPGYGLCEGKSTPKHIEDNTVVAAAALRKELGWSEEEFRQRTGVFGHSIGCAAALMAADVLQLKAAVLCAPFTSMTEMGRLILGWPLCCLNRHRFDNVAHLRKLDKRGAAVRIFHGAEDEIIPVRMGRELHALFPRTTQLDEVEEGRHNDVVLRARVEIGVAMQELAGKP
jgi:pimeloyl-ACP methyl ester carboxylesterase